jgi:hypothetical protein
MPSVCPTGAHCPPVKFSGTNHREHKSRDILKQGFKVANMDACLKHLNNLKIKVPRVWTDSSTGKRNFIIEYPDENLIQFFE